MKRNRLIHWAAMVTAALLVWASAGPAALAQEAGQPAQPSDSAAQGQEGEAQPQVPPAYASPRDTVATFLAAMNKLEQDRQDADAWRKVFGAMQMPAAAGDAARREVAWQLLGVFNALGRIDPQTMLPGPQETQRQELTQFEFFPDNPNEAAQQVIRPAIRQAGEPPAPIVLVRTDSGAWRFSGETLDSIGPLYTWARKRGVQYGADVRRFSRAAALREWIPESLQGRYFLGVELWQWAGLLIVIFLAVLADLLSRIAILPMIRRPVARYLAEPEPDELRRTVRPFGLAIGAAVFLLLLNPLGLGGTILLILAGAARVVLVFGVTWAAWTTTDLLFNTLVRRKAEDDDTTFEQMVVPLLRKTLKLFIAAMGAIYLAAAFEIPLVPLLGSFGLAGLAISFAAQDMVRNLFGGLSIFMDRPFKVGERINYKGYDGIIEEVGFRITRLRTLTGHLVTIPNGGISNEPVENISRRPSIRRILNVTITYDTPKDQVERAVRIISDILEEPDLAGPIHRHIGRELMAPRVFFNDFNAASLNIFVIYWHIPPDWWDYLEHAHRVNLRIFEEFNKAGIEFAFPTQTLYLAGDPKRELALCMLGEDLRDRPAG